MNFGFWNPDELQRIRLGISFQPQQFEIQGLSRLLAEKKGCQDRTELWNSFCNAFQTLLFSTPGSVRYYENAVSCLPSLLFLSRMFPLLSPLCSTRVQNGRDKTQSCCEYVAMSAFLVSLASLRCNVLGSSTMASFKDDITTMHTVTYGISVLLVLKV